MRSAADRRRGTRWNDIHLSVSSCSTGTFPIDLAKTRLQVQGQVGDSKYREIRYRGMLHAIVRIAREEGVRALYSGSVRRINVHVLLIVLLIGCSVDCPAANASAIFSYVPVTPDKQEFVHNWVYKRIFASSLSTSGLAAAIVPLSSILPVALSGVTLRPAFNLHVAIFALTCFEGFLVYFSFFTGSVGKSQIHMLYWNLM